MPVTLITGGTSGIGAATARALLDAGHEVAVTSRDEARLTAFAGFSGAGDKLLPIVADAAEDTDVRAAVAATVDRFGTLTNVVANAGFSTQDTLLSGDPAGWRDMVLVNVLGPMLLISAAADALADAVTAEVTPRVVLVGSVAGFKNSPGNTYSATKWAVTGLAENARLELTSRGVGVTLVAPGRTQTPFWDSRPAGRQVGPLLSAEDVGRAIAWALAQPPGVDVNTVVVRPVGQPN